MILLHGGKDLGTRQFIPGRGNDACLRIVRAQHGHLFLQLRLRDLLCSGKKKGSGIFNLVQIKLAEVLDIHLALGGIRDRDKAAHPGIRDFLLNALNRTDDIRKLADTAGLNQDAVRMILVNHLTQRHAEIAYQ